MTGSREYYDVNNIADVLGNINDSRAIEPIIRSLEIVRDVPYPRIQALNKLTGEHFTEVKNLQGWWEINKGKFKR